MRSTVLALIACSFACSSDPSGGGDAGAVDVGGGGGDSGGHPDALINEHPDATVDGGGNMNMDADVFADAAPDAGMTGMLASLSDDFSGAALDPSWTLFHDDVADVTVENGAMSITMTRGALWFNAGTSALLYKSVTGDFKLTGRVHARKSSDPSQPPTQTIHLGGLMARDPHGSDPGGQQNYVFIVVGVDGMDVSVETKSTTNNVSDFIGPTWPSTEAELRLCRLGDTFRLYKRELGAATWTLAMTYVRPDLPATLQVGANAYANAMMGMFDLRVFFDELTFAEAASEGDCSAD